MDSKDLKIILDDAQAVVFTDQRAIDALPQAWINIAKETLAILISNMLTLAKEVPCPNCDGNGFILGVTDVPDNKKNRPCKVCDGTGKKYDI